MLKDLLKKELRQLWLGAETLSAAETPSYGQVAAWRERSNGVEDRRATAGWGDGPAFWPGPREVLAVARAASGM